MAEMFTVVTPEEALQRLFEKIEIQPSGMETVQLLDSLGRVLANDICSPINLPSFPRATMDGYAVRASDTFGASEGAPVYLTVIGEVRMGEKPTVQPGQDLAVRIATGGMLPSGCDAVVMVEHTQEISPAMIEVMRPVAPGDNVAQVGEDIREGEVILERGHRLRPWDIGALAALGQLEVPVFARPRVAVISSGNEVVPPHQSPDLGQVRDINSYSVSAAVIETGGQPLQLGIVPDRRDELFRILSRAIQLADMVLVSGGSSVGAMDLTYGAINDLGEPGVIVHGLAVKPGKPTVLAAAQGKPIVGLPGHPVSALVIFDLIVKPILWRLTGYRPRWPSSGSVLARIARRLASAPGREDHVRVRLEKRNGEIWAVPILGKSGSISTLVRAVGEVVIPLDREGLEMGEEVEVRLP